MEINNYGTMDITGDIVEGDKIVNQGLSKDDSKELIDCVQKNGVTKEDVDALINVLKDINASQDDLTTEFANMASDWEASRKTGAVKKLQDGVTLTNGMVTLGKTAIGIATNNPVLALPDILKLAKDMAQ